MNVIFGIQCTLYDYPISHALLAGKKCRYI